MCLNLRLHEVKLGSACIQHRVEVPEARELAAQDIEDMSLSTQSFVHNSYSVLNILHTIISHSWMHSSHISRLLSESHLSLKVAGTQQICKCQPLLAFYSRNPRPAAQSMA